nr:toxin TcdB middle/C-terminal domain-containing protein [Candidatus Thiosymbion oneisti]
MDLAGDGQPDLVVLDGPTPGLYEHDGEAGWQPFRPFRSRLNRAMRDPNLRFLDLDGDGHADVLITEDDAFLWHRSLAEAGFGPPERVMRALDEETGPRLVFADATQSIYLADMCGDGLTDLVRLRNGEVCYWPNLGYGHFGAKVTMDNAPWFDHPEQFDQRRVRLADIDGSGTNDIIYLHRDGPRLYFNQSGNRLSEARQVSHFPPLDNLSTVMTADLLGNGTACLVWSSPLPGDARRQMRYIDLMGGTKPHLLIKAVNNLGAETQVHYAPSTRFYLADKLAGTPWVTRLPFPVQVVERVETRDRISGNRFVTRYAYHHGYFDGTEREFRGFGMVEQWDTEELGALGSAGIAEHAADGAPQSQAPKYAIGQPATCQIRGVWQFRFRPIIAIKPSIHVDGGWYYFFEGITSGIPEDDVLLLEDAGSHAPASVWDGTPEEKISIGCASNLDEASHIPPVHTKTWFHTGAYSGRERISRQHTRDYYGAPTDQAALDPIALEQFIAGELLPDTILPAGLTADEEREACRALKGSMLRQEVYALDGTDKQPHPYTVTEQNFTVRMMQPRGSNPHGVFLTHARESLSHHYERNPEDPRSGHALTLAVDDYGNVLKSAAIGYGRRWPDPTLAPADQAQQTQLHITYAENRVTNAVDAADTHRTPLPCESRTYELTGLSLPAERNRFTLDEILDAGEAATTLSYEEKPTAGSVQKRLIEHERTYYRRDDLAGPLPLGELQPLAVPFETYKLAFTPGLVAEIYGERAGDTMLEKEGRYVHTEGGVDWWIPSGQLFFSPDPDASPPQELAYAREHFFLPHRYRDSFHSDAVSTESFVGYDTYDLLVQETRDALDNRITVGERDPDPTKPLVKHGQDYRVLQPALVMDPNRNRSAVAFDALGMVVGTAVMGKPSPAPVEGDSLDGFCADLTQAEIDRFLAAPKGPPAARLLGDATSRVVYDLTAYRREPDPAKKPPTVAATLARETHLSDLADNEESKIQVSFSYSDGFGREIQKKIQAEPGPVPQRDAGGKIIVGADGRPVTTPDEVSPRWVGSGWTVFNNKGKPVRQYEPFFTDTHPFLRTPTASSSTPGSASARCSSTTRWNGSSPPCTPITPGKRSSSTPGGKRPGTSTTPL